MTITGTEFSGVSGVSFGTSAAASYTVSSSTSITAVSPAEVDGTVDITVTTPVGTSPTTTADQFSFQPTFSWFQASPQTARRPALTLPRPTTRRPSRSSSSVAATSIPVFPSTSATPGPGTAPPGPRWPPPARHPRRGQHGLRRGHGQLPCSVVSATAPTISATPGPGTAPAGPRWPPRRLSHVWGGMAYDPTAGQLILFGGHGYYNFSCSSSGPMADTWAWNGTAWAELSPATSPTSYQGPALAFDPATSQMVFYSFDTSNWTGTTWAQLSSSTYCRVISPPWRITRPRASLSCSVVTTTTGTTVPTHLGLDRHHLGPGCHPRTSPPGRWQAGIAFDANTDQMVLFGGSQINTNTPYNTWVIGAPSVTGVSPAARAAGTGGTTVTITGKVVSPASPRSTSDAAAAPLLRSPRPPRSRPCPRPGRRHRRHHRRRSRGHQPHQLRRPVHVRGVARRHGRSARRQGCRQVAPRSPSPGPTSPAPAP